MRRVGDHVSVRHLAPVERQNPATVGVKCQWGIAYRCRLLGGRHLQCRGVLHVRLTADVSVDERGHCVLIRGGRGDVCIGVGRCDAAGVVDQDREFAISCGPVDAVAGDPAYVGSLPVL